jgi:hypothetical protein
VWFGACGWLLTSAQARTLLRGFGPSAGYHSSMAILAITAAIEIGSLIYRLVDRPTTPKPPLSSLQISNAQNGAPIPFGYGTCRFAGQIIWTSGLQYKTTSSKKGGPSVVNYVYFTSFAIAFGEGPATINRIWGDSKLIYDANPSLSTDYPVQDYPVWDPTVNYSPGNLVAYNGQVYECLDTNTNQIPSALNTTYWNIQSDYPPWLNTQAYNAGDVVMYNGQLWVCVQGNTGVSPTSSIPSNRLLGNWGDWALLNQYYPAPTIYPGDEAQNPDPTIQATQGASVTPAYRGICYAVFENFPLANFGDRIPNLRAEVTFTEYQQPALGSNLIANGNWTGPTYAVNDVPDWTIGGANPYTQLSTGANPTNLVNLFTTPGNTGVGTLSQTVSTVPGQTYRLTYQLYCQVYAYGTGGGGTLPFNVATFGVKIGGVPIPDVAVTVDITAINEEDSTPLTTYTYEFVAIASSTTIEFDFSAPTRFDFDNYWALYPVSLQEVLSDQPETLLPDVVTDVMERAGLASSQIDVSLLNVTNIQPTLVVQGYLIDQPRSAAEILKVLMQAYFFDICETGGKLKSVPRGLPSAMTIPESALGLIEDKAKLIPEEIAQERDLPQLLTVLYTDPALDYQQNKQPAQRNLRIIHTRQQILLQIPMTMDADWAIQVAEKALFVYWLERFRYLMHLWCATYLVLDPTDVVDFVYEGLTFQMRIEQMTLGQGFVSEIGGSADNPNSYLSSATGGTDSAFTPAATTSVGITLLWLFDIPLLQDSDANPSGTGFYWAVSSQLPEWGGATLEDSNDNSDFEALADSGQAVTFGYATTILGAPRSPWEWDMVNTLTVKLTVGAFAGDSQLDVLNGSNGILVGSEVVQFQNAVQNMDGTWTLSGLLRGLRGTEQSCGTHGANELIILLSSGMQRQDDALSLIGQELYYEAVTSGQDPSTAPSYQFTIAGNDLKPYAPAGIGGTVDGSGDITITWIRRTRIGGEADWADGVTDVPLSEDSELYDIDVLNGSTVVRTISGLTTPTCVYTAAMQTADFGSVQSSVNVNVYQRSAQVGRGFGANGSAPTPAGSTFIPWPAVPAGSGQLFYVNGS